VGLVYNDKIPKFDVVLTHGNKQFSCFKRLGLRSISDQLCFPDQNVGVIKTRTACKNRLNVLKVDLEAPLNAFLSPCENLMDSKLHSLQRHAEVVTKQAVRKFVVLKCFKHRRTAYIDTADEKTDP
jgi:hypothetical protein